MTQNPDEFRAASEAAQKAIAIDPESEWAFRLQSVAFAGQKKSDAALAAALEAVRVAPEEPLALLNLADCQLNMGLVTHAEFTTRALLRSAPESANTFNTLGRIALYDQDKAAARKYFEKSLALNPDEPAFHYNLGLTHMENWQFSKAEKRFREGLRLDPVDKSLQKMRLRMQSRRRLLVALAALVAGPVLYFIFR